MDARSPLALRARGETQRFVAAVQSLRGRVAPSQRYRALAHRVASGPRRHARPGETHGRLRSHAAPADARTSEGLPRGGRSQRRRRRARVHPRGLGRLPGRCSASLGGGIAEQRHAAPSPAATERPVIRERRLDCAWFRRLDQRRNGVEPSAVTAEELVPRSLGRGCALGYGLEAVPVQATRPGRAEAGAAADAPDLDEAVADALVVEASPRSPGAMSAVAQRLSPKSDLRTVDRIPSAPTTMSATTASAPSRNASPSSRAPTQVVPRRRRSAGTASSITCCSSARRIPYVSQPSPS
jgi:hypothetical protein